MLKVDFKFALIFRKIEGYIKMQNTANSLQDQYMIKHIDSQICLHLFYTLTSKSSILISLATSK